MRLPMLHPGAAGECLRVRSGWLQGSHLMPGDLPARDDDGMTADETQAQPGTAPPRGYPPLSALRRSRTDRKLFGVAGGLGRYAGVDPLIFRILFVVLAVFGGSGILLYALGWLLIPDEGQEESEGQRLVRGHAERSTVSTVVAGVVVLILGLVFMGTVLDTGAGIGGLGALVVVGLIVALLLNRGQRPDGEQPPSAPTYGPVPPPQEPGSYGQTPGTAYAAAAPAQAPPSPPSWTAPTQPLPPPPPPPPRERSILGRATFSTALIVVGLMIGWNFSSDNDFKTVTILASALAVVGAGVVVGAFRGRAPWLIVLGIVLSFLTSIAAVADHHWGGGVGDRTWRPQTVTAAERPFRLGVGEATLDLTELPAGSSVDVQTRLGVGDLVVLVPLDASVEVQADVGAGQLDVLDQPGQDGTDLAETASDPAVLPGSGRSITLDAAVGLGHLEVRRAAS
jgi:phage shock protein PspC (stress-responsive transcriptional regulator)